MKSRILSALLLSSPIFSVVSCFSETVQTKDEDLFLFNSLVDSLKLNVDSLGPVEYNHLRNLILDYREQDSINQKLGSISNFLTRKIVQTTSADRVKIDLMNFPNSADLELISTLNEIEIKLSVGKYVLQKKINFTLILEDELYRQDVLDLFEARLSDYLAKYVSASTTTNDKTAIDNILQETDFDRIFLKFKNLFNLSEQFNFVYANQITISTSANYADLSQTDDVDFRFSFNHKFSTGSSRIVKTKFLLVVAPINPINPSLELEAMATSIQWLSKFTLSIVKRESVIIVEKNAWNAFASQPTFSNLIKTIQSNDANFLMTIIGWNKTLIEQNLILPGGLRFNPVGVQPSDLLAADDTLLNRAPFHQIKSVKFNFISTAAPRSFGNTPSEFKFYVIDSNEIRNQYDLFFIDRITNMNFDIDVSYGRDMNSNITNASVATPNPYADSVGKLIIDAQDILLNSVFYHPYNSKDYQVIYKTATFNQRQNDYILDAQINFGTHSIKQIQIKGLIRSAEWRKQKAYELWGDERGFYRNKFNRPALSQTNTVYLSFNSLTESDISGSLNDPAFINALNVSDYFFALPVRNAFYSQPTSHWVNEFNREIKKSLNDLSTRYDDEVEFRVMIDALNVPSNAVHIIVKTHQTDLYGTVMPGMAKVESQDLDLNRILRREYITSDAQWAPNNFYKYYAYSDSERLGKSQMIFFFIPTVLGSIRTNLVSGTDFKILNSQTKELVHELGHVLGLDHTHNYSISASLSTEATSTYTSYGQFVSSFSTPLSIMGYNYESAVGSNNASHLGWLDKQLIKFAYSDSASIRNFYR